MGLHPRTVADFYHELMSILTRLVSHVTIYTTPQEVPSPIPCDVDTVHASYDEEYANRFWRILVETDSVFKEFRGRFHRKVQPGAFLLGQLRSRGDPLLRPTSAASGLGPTHIQREAYSHECSSAGFWPGSGSLLAPAYYAYTVPAPSRISKASVRPDAAYFDRELGEFILLYDDMRKAPDPRTALLDFLQTTYEAGANLGGWDRYSLER